MTGLINLYFGAAELFVGLTIINLLIFGVIYSKLGGMFGQSLNYINLGLLTLFLTSIILIQEALTIGHNILSIAGGLFVFEG